VGKFLIPNSGPTWSHLSQSLSYVWHNKVLSSISSGFFRMGISDQIAATSLMFIIYYSTFVHLYLSSEDKGVRQMICDIVLLIFHIALSQILGWNLKHDPNGTQASFFIRGQGVHI